MPGFYYNCLTNPRLPASTRMYQFKNKPKWESHIQRHVSALEEKSIRCELQTPQCSLTFNSALELQFHLQDAHGIHSCKRPKGQKRPRNELNEGYSIQPNKKRITLQNRAEDQPSLLENIFTNSAISSMEATAASKSTSKSSSANHPLLAAQLLVAADMTAVFDTAVIYMR